MAKNRVMEYRESTADKNKFVYRINSNFVPVSRAPYLACSHGEFEKERELEKIQRGEPVESLRPSFSPKRSFEKSDR